MPGEYISCLLSVRYDTSKSEAPSTAVLIAPNSPVCSVSVSTGEKP